MTEMKFDRKVISEKKIGHMTFRSNGLSVKRHSVKRRSVKWYFGQMVFGQIVFWSNGVRSKKFGKMTFR
jgi:hypothetical protein